MLGFGFVSVVTLPAIAIYVWYSQGFVQAALFAAISASARALLNFVSKGFIIGGMITRYERAHNVMATHDSQLPHGISIANGWREVVVSTGVPVAAYLIMF